MSPSFISGLELSRRFANLVQPIIDEALAGAGSVPYATALIGPGSEVLGYDDEMSTDHHWGPRLMLFLDSTDHHRWADTLRTTLAHRLPREFMGFATHWSAPDGDDSGVQTLVPAGDEPINHRVEIIDLPQYLHTYLGAPNVPMTRPDHYAHSLAAAMSTTVWRSLPEQRLLSLTAGAVYHDKLGLTTVREMLRWYPDEVWRLNMAGLWRRIAQEQHLVGRAGLTGDELGARLLAGRLVRDVMRLAFHQSRRYAPYAKWFGRAFRALPLAVDLTPHLEAALDASDWRDRDAALARAYRALVQQHNALRLGASVGFEPRRFHNRPFQVCDADACIDTLLAPLPAATRRQFRARPFGNLDSLSDNVDLLEATRLQPLVGDLL